MIRLRVVMMIRLRVRVRIQNLSPKLRKAKPYAILCMAVCDVDRRILFYSCEQAPTTHDSLAWALSDLGAAVNNGELPAPFFINA